MERAAEAHRALGPRRWGGWRRRAAEGVRDAAGMPGAGPAIRSLLGGDSFWDGLGAVADAAVAEGRIPRIESGTAATHGDGSAGRRLATELAGAIDPFGLLDGASLELRLGTAWAALATCLGPGPSDRPACCPDVDLAWDGVPPLDAASALHTNLAHHPSDDRPAAWRQVLTWLAAPDGVAVLVEADPHTGATTFACEVVRRLQPTRPVVGVVGGDGSAFARPRDPTWSASWLRSLNAQLIRLLEPGHGLAPASEEVPQFRALLDRASAHPAGVVVVVDGIGERGRAGDRSDVDLLEALAVRPTGVSFVVTSRPEASLPTRHPLAERRLSLAPSPAVDAWRARAQRWLAQIAHDADEPRSRRRARPPRPPGAPELVATLAIARGPMTVDDLADLWGISADAARAALEPHRAFLAGPDDDGCIWLAHSLLADGVRRSSPAVVSAAEVRLADWADRHAARGWPVATPRYLLHRWHAHLETPAERASLMTSGWLRAAATTPGAETDGLASLAREAVTHLAARYLETGDDLAPLVEAAGSIVRVEGGQAMTVELVSALLDAGRVDDAYRGALRSKDTRVLIAAAFHPALRSRRDELLNHADAASDPTHELGPRLLDRLWRTLLTGIGDRPGLVERDLDEAVRAVRLEMTPGTDARACWAHVVSTLAAVDLGAALSVAHREVFTEDDAHVGATWVALIPHLAATSPELARAVIDDELTASFDVLEAVTALAPFLDDPADLLTRTLPQLDRAVRRGGALASWNSPVGRFLARWAGVDAAAAAHFVRTTVRAGHDRSQAYMAMLPEVAAHDPVAARSLLAVLAPVQRVEAWAAIAPVWPDPAAAHAECRRIIREELDRSYDRLVAWLRVVDRVAAHDVPHAVRLAAENLPPSWAQKLAWERLAPRYAALDPVAAEQWIRDAVADPRDRSAAWLAAAPHLGAPARCVAEAAYLNWPRSMSPRREDRLVWAVLAGELAMEHSDLALRIAADDVGGAWSTAWAMSIPLVVAAAPATALQALQAHADSAWPQDWVGDWSRVATRMLTDEEGPPAGGGGAATAEARHAKTESFRAGPAAPTPTEARIDAVRAEITRAREVPPTSAERLLGERDRADAPPGLITAVRAADVERIHRFVRDDMPDDELQARAWLALRDLRPADARLLDDARGIVERGRPTRRQERAPTWVGLIPWFGATDLAAARHTIATQVGDPWARAESWEVLVAQLARTDAAAAIRFASSLGHEQRPFTAFDPTSIPASLRRAVLVGDLIALTGAEASRS